MQLGVIYRYGNINYMYDKVILISLDTFRSDCINYNPTKMYPQEYKLKNKIKKSFLEEICSQGFFFNNVISAAPYTSASHAAYFSGLWPKNNRLFDQFNSKMKARSIFEMAKKAGYETSLKTDFPFIIGKYLNMIKGVDNYFIEDDNKALDLLKKKNKSFTMFHFGQIHYPYGFHSLKYGGKDYIRKVEEIEKKYNIKSEKVDLDDMAVETFRTKRDLSFLYRYKKIISSLYKKRMDNELFDLYIEGINYFHKSKFDNFLKKLLKIVEKKNYLLVIFSDHGEAWNDRTYGHHNSLDEGVIRVPMIFYAKDINPAIYQNRIRTVDLAPTLNELLFGEKIKFDGMSLKEIIFNNKIINDLEAFSAVWVTEIDDVLQHCKEVIDYGSIKTNRDRSVKYSECLYRDNFKFIKNYKSFINRSEKLEKNDTEILIGMKKFNKLDLVTNKEEIKKMRRAVKKYNDVAVNHAISKTKEIKEYFNLLGYKV